MYGGVSREIWEERKGSLSYAGKSSGRVTGCSEQLSTAGMRATCYHGKGQRCGTALAYGGGGTEWPVPHRLAHRLLNWGPSAAKHSFSDD